MKSVVRTAALLLCSSLLAACATQASDAYAPLRIVVKLAQPSEDGVAVARMVSRSAGVPARYLAATSSAWHAVALECASVSACEAALQRLREDRTNFSAIERDERKRIVTP